MEIGELIQKLRKAQGLTQREVAAKMGVQPSYVSQLESGKNTFSMKQADKIGEALGTDGATLGLTSTILKARTAIRQRNMSEAGELINLLAEALESATLSEKQRQDLASSLRGLLEESGHIKSAAGATGRDPFGYKTQKPLDPEPVEKVETFGMKSKKARR